MSASKSIAAQGAVLLLTAGAAWAQREPPVPKELLERVGEWADNYPGSIPNYAARETLVETRYDKRGKTETERRWEFDYVLERPAAKRELVETRTRAVEEETGTRTEGKRGRRESADAVSAEFEKLILLPTRFAARNQEKMKYYFGQDDSDAHTDAVVIGYRQASDEGLLEMDGKAVRVSGRAWVDPDDGRIVRIEEQFENKGALYFTSVDFAQAEGVDHWLPMKINVQYFDKGRLAVQKVYTYEGFRRLDSKRTSGAAPPSPK